MTEYWHSNATIISKMAELYEIDGDLFWMQVNRSKRTMTNTQTGAAWNIPDDWNLT